MPATLRSERAPTVYRSPSPQLRTPTLAATTIRILTANAALGFALEDSRALSRDARRRALELERCASCPFRVTCPDRL